MVKWRIKMTTINDILGNPCIHQERFTFDKCRNCTGRDYRCENYQSNHSRPTKRLFTNQTLMPVGLHFPTATYNSEVKE